MSIKHVNSQSVSSITYAGTALTRIGFSSTSGTDRLVEMWRLVAPATGTNNVIVTMSAAAQLVVGAASFNGVHQTIPAVLD